MTKRKINLCRRCKRKKAVRMRTSFSHVSSIFLPTFFSLRTLEKSFLHILLVGEEGKEADASDNVSMNI